MSELLAGLETYLYVISSSLFYPVILALVGMTFWIVFCFGMFLRDWTDKKDGASRGLNQYRTDLQDEIDSYHREDAEHLDARLERLLQESELRMVKELDRIRFVVRAGPAVGLMGTLIPMGVALSSMAKGNMPKMAESMVTAFTTTVVGLACGVAAYLMSMAKEKWVREDMREMEYETELAMRDATQETQHNEETSS